VPDNVNVEATTANVNADRVNVPRVDPLVGLPNQFRAFAGVTFAGLVAVLFFWLVMDLRSQSDRVMDKIQSMIDKQNDRDEKAREKEAARQDKIHEYSDTKLRDWIKSSNERQVLENDKMRGEIKALTEHVKLLTDRIRMVSLSPPSSAPVPGTSVAPQMKD
jgi:hypothetical protein